jgi:hypothetical protein
VPSPTLSRAKRLVAAGLLRYFLLSQPGTGFIGRQPTGQALAITTWVRHECAPVTSAAAPLYRCGTVSAAHSAHSSRRR